MEQMQEPQSAAARVAVVLATYNERVNIERLLPELLGLALRPQVIVVDDGSPDGTAQVVREWTQREPGRVALIERPRKAGYGSAFVLGFRRALGADVDVVVSMDADYSHDPQSIPALVERLTDCDLAIGSRYVGGIRILNWSMRRLLLSSAANQYVKLILGFKVTDCTSGFRAYRAEGLRAIPLERAHSQGYAFLVEILEAVTRRRLVVAEVPIVYTERREGHSKMSKGVIVEAVLRPWAILLGRLGKP